MSISSAALLVGQGGRDAVSDQTLLRPQLQTLSYILKNTSNPYIFKYVLDILRNYPEGHRKYFPYTKPDSFLETSVFETFLQNVCLFNKGQTRLFFFVTLHKTAVF